jgi:hypothetical protein
MKARGILLTVLGLALAVYSVPFVTAVAVAVFLLGAASIAIGLRLFLKGRAGSAN